MKKRSNFNIVFNLIGLIKPLIFIMILAIIMGVIGFLASIFITVGGGYGLVYLLGDHQYFSLQTIIIALLIFAFVRGFLRYAEQASNHYIAFKLLALLRDKVFRQLRRLAPAKLDGKKKGDLIALITSDIELLEVFYAHTISPVAIAVIVSLIMTFFIGNFHWSLGLMAVVAYLLVGVAIPVLISKLGAKSGANFRNEVGRLNTYYLDSIRGLQEVIQYNQKAKRLAHINQQTKNINKINYQLKKYEGLSVGLTNIVIFVMTSAVLLMSINLYQNNQVGLVGLLIPPIALVSSFGPVVALANLSNNLLQTFASGQRVLDLLDEQPLVNDITKQKDITSGDLVFDDVSFKYNDETHKVLDHFDLAMKENKITGIVGKSGSGKSTLLKLLMRFYEVDEGQILINEDNINNINTSSLKAYESLVAQDTYLFNESIEYNVKVANLKASREEVIKACKKASIHDFIMTLPDGYDTNVGELGDNLSGGERQRLGVARAFLHQSQLIMLDEATSNLDSLNEAVILKALAAEKKHKTIILVSHRYSTMGIADDIIKMESGYQS